MGKKNRTKARQADLTRQRSGRRITALLAAIPLGTVIAVLALAYTYKSTGSDDLRSRVYQPLFADLMSIKESVQSLAVEKPPSLKALPELKQSGAFLRVPVKIRSDFDRIADEASKVHSAALTLNELVLREISSRIMQIRAESDDREWHARTSRTLINLSLSQKGVGESVTQTFTHEARSRAMDVRNPKQPIVSAPGGPTFVVRDWLTYPGSLKVIDGLWSDLDYLYFNPRIDGWYWQLTREDLKRTGANLEAILTPVHQVLGATPKFTYLRSAREPLLVGIQSLEATLTDRILDPKQIEDLFSR